MTDTTVPRWKRWLPFAVLGAALFADQLSKVLVRDAFGPGGELAGKHVRLLGDFFWLHFHENKGVAFGLFSGLPAALSVPLFVAVTAGALWLIVRYYRQFRPGQLAPRLALMLIGGGALGNVFDRLAFGRVTDFFDFAYYNAQTGAYRNYWPIWNVADACIVVGVSILFVVMLLEKKPAKETGKTADGAPPAAGEGNAP